MSIGSSVEIYQKWRYRVTIDGIDGEALFQKAGPLKANIAVAKYKGGGAIIEHKQLASATYDPITLERGSTIDRALYNWFKECLDAAANKGDDQFGYKRNMAIEELDRLGIAIKTWNIYDAMITSFQPGDWDGTADEFNLETIELEYDYFELDDGDTAPGESLF